MGGTQIQLEWTIRCVLFGTQVAYESWAFCFVFVVVIVIFYLFFAFTKACWSNKSYFGSLVEITQ